VASDLLSARQARIVYRSDLASAASPSTASSTRHGRGGDAALAEVVVAPKISGQAGAARESNQPTRVEVPVAAGVNDFDLKRVGGGRWCRPRTTCVPVSGLKVATKARPTDAWLTVRVARGQVREVQCHRILDGMTGGAGR
jgi:hypothetical protein